MAGPLELNLNPDARTLRQFGGIALGALALLGGLVAWRGGLLGFDFGGAARTVAIALWSVGALSALLGLVAPRANRPLWIALTLVAFPIGYAVSIALLGVLFFGVLTPVSLVFRLTGRDALRRRFDPAAQSYWIERSGDVPLERYFRQF
jgi:hypothetical protein